MLLMYQKNSNQNVGEGGGEKSLQKGMELTYQTTTSTIIKA